MTKKINPDPMKDPTNYIVFKGYLTLAHTAEESERLACEGINNVDLPVGVCVRCGAFLSWTARLIREHKKVCREKR